MRGGRKACKLYFFLQVYSLCFHLLTIDTRELGDRWDWILKRLANLAKSRYRRMKTLTPPRKRIFKIIVVKEGKSRLVRLGKLKLRENGELVSVKGRLSKLLAKYSEGVC